MINKVFQKRIGRNIEVYVDDMIVKCTIFQDHLSDLEEFFQTIRDYNILLNLTKCNFSLGSGKFRCYLVSKRGIEANLEKIKGYIGYEISTYF